MMRRWVPFIILMLFVLIFIYFLLFTSQTSEYLPKSSDPSLVYKEACSGCHGVQGEGTGLIYPDLTEEMLTENGVMYIVKKGELFMPSFPFIPDSTLKKLASYVAEKKFRNE